MLRINEIFFSIQGESSYAGKPCIFVRLAYCDLRCSYCDTKYAYYEGTEMSIDDIVQKIQEYPCSLVEITGGEPLLQKNVYPLMSVLCDLSYDVMIETGGHISVNDIDIRVKKIMDIKTPSSNMSMKNNYENIKALSKKDEVKFVIGNREDYAWAKKVIEEHQLPTGITVLFSPVFDVMNLSNLASWILEDGLKVRLQLQLHKFIWHHETRGV